MRPGERGLVALARVGRVCGLLAVLLLGVVVAGVAIDATSDWSWSSSLLTLLVTGLAVLALTCVVFEAAHRLGLVLRARQEGGQPPTQADPPAESSGAGAMSDEAMRGYFLGLHDRERPPGGGEPVA